MCGGYKEYQTFTFKAFTVQKSFSYTKLLRLPGVKCSPGKWGGNAIQPPSELSGKEPYKRGLGVAFD